MIRVLLADDEELIREALAALLERESDVEVIGAVGSGREAIEAARRHRPDVVVTDLAMPGLDGLQVVHELSRTLAGCPVVVLTAHGSPLALRRALSSGARGFLAKEAPGTALADVVRRVHDGNRYVDPLLAADALTAPPNPLSPREAEVLCAAGPDGAVQHAARTLYLAPGTIRNYLASAVTKLGAAGRAEAHRIARDNGWI